MVGKAVAFAFFPFFLAIVLVVALLGMAAVVVDHSAKVVGVALASVPHIGTGILKHGHDEWNHVAVGVHVLNGLEHPGALPFPAVEVGLEVPAVAGPHCHNVAAQALLVVAVLVDGSDKGVVLALICGLKLREIILDVVASDGEIDVA